MSNKELSCLNIIKRNRKQVPDKKNEKPNGEETSEEKEEKDENILNLVMILIDRSGSTSSWNGSQINGVKTFFEDRKKNKQKTLIYFSTFNSNIINHLDWKESKYINYSIDELNNILKPEGSTRLIDSACETIELFKKKIISEKDNYKYIRGIFAILTDGLDNQSRIYNKQDLNFKIKEIEETGIISMFLAANQDAIKKGANFGFNCGNSLNINSNNSLGGFKSLSSATERVISGPYMKPQLSRENSTFSNQERHISFNDESFNKPELKRFFSINDLFLKNDNKPQIKRFETLNEIM